MSNLLVQTAYAAGEETISIKLAPYVVGHIGSLPITSTLLMSWVAMFVLAALAIWVGRNPKLIPGKLQSIFELVVGGVFDYIKDVLQSETMAKKYFPIILTVFLYILFMNWLGLFPGVSSIGIYQGHGEESHFVPLFAPGATDLNITLAFTIVVFVVIEMAGILALGTWRYLGKFLNFSSPLNFAVGIIELFSELARLISFSFRLFGNIFAGKTLLLVVMFLATPYIVPVPILAYELGVGFIQAFIFAILTLYFIKIAVEEPH